MTRPDQVLSEFIDAWNAGERPRAEDYLDRVAPAERAALADRIGDWLDTAPQPRYDDAALAALRAEPAVAEVVGALGRDEQANALFANVGGEPKQGWAFEFTPEGLDLLWRTGA